MIKSRLAKDVLDYLKGHKEVIVESVIVAGYVIFGCITIGFESYEKGRGVGNAEMSRAFINHNDDMITAYTKAMKLEEKFKGPESNAKWDSRGEEIYENVMTNIKKYDLD